MLRVPVPVRSLLGVPLSRICRSKSRYACMLLFYRRPAGGARCAAAAERDGETEGRPLVPLSPCPLVPLSPCPLVPLSPCPLVPLSPCPLVPLSPCPLVSPSLLPSFSSDWPRRLYCDTYT